MRNRNRQRAKRERRAARKRKLRRPVLINGKQYDYASITITIDGEPYDNYTTVDYTGPKR